MMYSEVTSVYVPVKTPDYKGWAILLSVLGHVILLLALAFFYHSPPQPMETTLITPEQLAELEGQIRANQQNNAGDVGGTDSPIQDVSNWLSDVAKPSSNQSENYDNQVTEVKQDLAAKEAAWRQEQAKFAEQIDQQTAQEQQQLIEELNTAQTVEQDALKQSRQAESNRDAIRQELIDAHEAYNKTALPNRNEDAKATSSSRSLSLADDGQSMGGALSRGSSAARSGGASGSSSAGYLSLVKGRITSNWNPPTNSNGKSLRASFTITASGGITNISVSGSGDEAFKQSLIQAIQAASPLPPPPDDEDVKRINSTFVAN